MMAPYADVPAKLVNNVAELLYWFPIDRPADDELVDALMKLRGELYELQASLDDRTHADMVGAIIEALERTLS